jgi:hypothetical protein
LSYLVAIEVELSASVRFDERVGAAALRVDAYHGLVQLAPDAQLALGVDAPAVAVRDRVRLQFDLLMEHNITGGILEQARSKLEEQQEIHLL